MCDYAHMKLGAIKELLSTEVATEVVEALAVDSRVGVQKLVASYWKRQEKEQIAREQFYERTAYERQFRSKGYKLIAGVDEAGRGPLAGPLTVAAVILPEDVYIAGLNDSKQLSASKREQLYDEIVEKAMAISLNIVGPAEIDSYNIYRATQLSMQKVIEHLAIKPDMALIDAMPVNSEQVPTYSLVHGDALSVSIAAASIIAKVARDRIMVALDGKYPEYGFAGNKGYGSGSHMEAIRVHGATKWHRRSYEPIKSMGLIEAACSGNELKIIK